MRWRSKQMVKIIIVLIIILGIIGFLFSLYCNYKLKIKLKTYKIKKINEIENADYAIVPGALVYKSGKPSFAYEDRLTGGYELYRSKKVTTIILSGAKRENAAGKRWLMNKGVKGRDILIDDGGLDTYSTIHRCKNAFLGKTFLVCTQEKYFRRTSFLMQELGMKGNCVGIDNHSYRKEIYERFRDFFAADKAWIECRITKPEPLYSLKKLPIE